MTVFAPGTLVHTRGREWVVLPESAEDLLVLRPLGGSDAEVAGVFPAFEDVRSATFALPDPERVGDFGSAQLLRDALVLGFRSSAGPFRSFGSIDVDPRPYQLVPLLLALRHDDPVRLLIADDVGIGKTIEAALIAKELLAQGAAERLAVICPPHLVEQWQGELWSKFRIEAEAVTASTAGRLERDAYPQSLFERHPATVISIDWVKSDARRHTFLINAPDLVIVDEAHACADPAGSTARHQRYQVLKGLASDAHRHLILVTATPHSGNAGAFAGLCGMLDPRLADLATEGADSEALRRVLAEHFVQRRRPDIEHYLGEDTHFARRESAELAYRLGDTPARRLFDDVLTYARTTVRDARSGTRQRERVQWWSAIALLRAMASSPAAAAATLRRRAASADANTEGQADAIGRRAVMDEDDTDADALDITPGADTSDGAESDAGRALRAFADRADEIAGAGDVKLKALETAIRNLLRDEYQPIVFCRFVDTAEYVAAQLRDRLPRTVDVGVVTGRLPGEERERLVADLVDKQTKRVLVTTDCLSEGINLQDGFNAVVHYDLAWNPTRHEQREGRVDRFGQLAPVVRIVTLYGSDTQVDGLVLKVLLQKHAAIRAELGVSVAVPGNASDVFDAVIGGLLLNDTATDDEVLSLFDPEDYGSPQHLQLELEFAAARERASRTRYAQGTVGTDEVERHLKRARTAIGTSVDVERFVTSAIRRLGGAISPAGPGANRIDLSETPRAVQDLVGDLTRRPIAFRDATSDGAEVATRTHPLVERLAAHVLDAALDPALDGVARRAGAIRTNAVDTRTTLLLLRLRFQLTLRRGRTSHPLIAEDQAIVAFQGAPTNPVWLDLAEAEALLHAPATNLPHDHAVHAVRTVVDSFGSLIPHLRASAERVAGRLEAEHAAVRDQARTIGSITITTEEPDVLGIYVLLPQVAP